MYLPGYSPALLRQYHTLYPLVHENRPCDTKVLLEFIIALGASSHDVVKLRAVARGTPLLALITNPVRIIAVSIILSIFVPLRPFVASFPSVEINVSGCIHVLLRNEIPCTHRFSSRTHWEEKIRHRRREK